MVKNSVNVLGTCVDLFSEEELENTFSAYLSGIKEGQGTLVKLNPEIILESFRSKDYNETLKDFNLNLVDGNGLKWAVKYLSLPLVNFPIIRTVQAVWQMIYSGASLVLNPSYAKSAIPFLFNGFDAMNLMLKVAIENKAPVYFFGAEKKVLQKAIEEIRKEYPDLFLAGYHDGYNYDDQEMIEKIKSSGAKMLFVALGHPKQENWIRDHLSKIPNVKIAIAEGGTFDFWAGDFKRAPKWMRNLGLEWLFRLFFNKSKTTGKESRKKRVFNAVPVFIYEIVKFKIRSK